LYSIANIINLNDDNARALGTLQMNKGKQKVIIDSNFVEIQSNKPRQLNEESSNILALIKAKKVKHEASSIMVDSRNNMETSTTKWKCILIVIMANGHAKHFHNGRACKD
jgi:hypothetical protein